MCANQVLIKSGWCTQTVFVNVPVEVVKVGIYKFICLHSLLDLLVTIQSSRLLQQKLQ
jgi:hypothetical protein